jgi:hypothetical protein
MKPLLGSIASGFGMEFIGAPFPRQSHPREAVGFPPVMNRQTLNLVLTKA